MAQLQAIRKSTKKIPQNVKALICYPLQLVFFLSPFSFGPYFYGHPHVRHIAHHQYFWTLRDWHGLIVGLDTRISMDWSLTAVPVSSLNPRKNKFTFITSKAVVKKVQLLMRCTQRRSHDYIWSEVKRSESAGLNGWPDNLTTLLTKCKDE